MIPMAFKTTIRKIPERTKRGIFIGAAVLLGALALTASSVKLPREEPKPNIAEIKLPDPEVRGILTPMQNIKSVQVKENSVFAEGKKHPKLETVWEVREKNEYEYGPEGNKDHIKIMGISISEVLYEWKVEEMDGIRVPGGSRMALFKANFGECYALPVSRYRMVFEEADGKVIVRSSPPPDFGEIDRESCTTPLVTMGRMGFAIPDPPSLVPDWEQSPMVEEMQMILGGNRTIILHLDDEPLIPPSVLLPRRVPPQFVPNPSGSYPLIVPKYILGSPPPAIMEKKDGNAR